MGSFFPVLRRNCAHWSICDITEHKCVTVLTLRPDAKKLRLTALCVMQCDHNYAAVLTLRLNAKKLWLATVSVTFCDHSGVASSSLLVDVPSGQDRISSGSYIDSYRDCSWTQHLSRRLLTSETGCVHQTINRPTGVSSVLRLDCSRQSALNH